MVRIAGAAGARLGRARLSRRRARADAQLAALARQLDRGRHLRDPAQHHRQARARPAGLDACPCSSCSPKIRSSSRRPRRTSCREHSPVARVRALRDARRGRLLARRCGSRWRSSAGWGSRSPRRSAAPAWGSPSSPSCWRSSAARSRPEPFLATVLLAGQALLRAGSEAQQKAWLARAGGAATRCSRSPIRSGRPASTCTAIATAGGARGRGLPAHRREDRRARRRLRRCLRGGGADRRRATPTARASACSWCRADARGLAVARQ